MTPTLVTPLYRYRYYTGEVGNMITARNAIVSQSVVPKIYTRKNMKKTVAMGLQNNDKNYYYK